MTGSPLPEAAGKNAGHHAGNCRWAVPTLGLSAPFWWNAEQCPWACVRRAVPRVLETTDECATCPHWEARPVDARGVGRTALDGAR